MIKNVAALFVAIAIPCILLTTVWQSGRYSAIENELRALEKEQYATIEANTRLIAGITVLSTPERIERVATTDLAMRKARPEEIVRIELGKGDLGG